MIKIYGDPISGNCYKLKLLMELSGRPYQWVNVNILKSESRTPEFLAKNPNGRIPIVEREDGSILPESNAALFYLSQGTPFWPGETLDQAKTLQWMFFEQYSHEPYIATSRFWLKFLNQPEEYKEKLKERKGPGIAALEVMELELSKQLFMATAKPTIADIALYAYTHVAHEGGFDLAGFPNIRNWLSRVEALPGFAPMV